MFYGGTGKFVSHDMKAYALNEKECQRKTLLKDFMFCDFDSASQDKCKCCDVCGNNI